MQGRPGVDIGGRSAGEQTRGCNDPQLPPMVEVNEGERRNED
jgi:hypothetical protein